jgi:uncharacterized protein (DUF885 family)
MRRYLFPVAVSLIAIAAPLAAATPAEQLQQLFKDSDEALLKRQPVNALFRGDLRYADQLGDLFSDAATDANYRADIADLAALARIDRSKLNATDRIAYDTFKRNTEIDRDGMTPAMRALRDVRPLDHFYGAHTWYPDIASGQGAAPFKTVADYENNVKRHRQFAVQIDAAIGRFREGMKSGVVQPKLIVRNMIEQLDTQLKTGVEGSTFMGPLKAFPEGISLADRTRLTAETTAAVRDGIFPAYVRLRNFLRDSYLPVAREGVGLAHMPGGLALYRYMIESNTTLPMTPDQIHNLGLSEVARITREMETIKTKVGFKGTLPQFFEHLRASPQFKFKSKEEMRDEFLSVGKRVDLKVRDQFSTIPKTALEIRPVPEYREKTDAGGSYNQGTPDGSRPGVFYYNSYDLPSRSKVGSETLYLHEAVPGHHFQISLAQENTALPPFMRFGGNTAYVEGWALYAETLWPELGVETDPYQRFGGLDDEMLRALRLVVDSGLHAKKWTRDQAIAYMLAHSGMSRTDATIEVERYIAIPGQALAYKIGQLTILKLKAEAKAKLGAKFDAKKFHAQVLMTGALPMTVLEAKLRAWIAGGGK